MSLCSRPRTIDNVAHQEEVISTLTRALETANVRTDQFCAAVCFAALLHRAGVLVVTATYWNLLWNMSAYQNVHSGSDAVQMPHLLFYGPPGTGKTTTALAIGRQLFGFVHPTAIACHLTSALHACSPHMCQREWPE